MPGRDCSIGGGTQHASSAASSSLTVLIGALGLWAAALPASVAITSTSPAIRERDLIIDVLPAARVAIDQLNLNISCCARRRWIEKRRMPERHPIGCHVIGMGQLEA